MAQKRYGDKFILVKLEPNYGVDSGPIGGDAVRAMNLVRASYEGSRVERTYDRKSMGSFAQLNTSPYVQLTFDVELGAGAGAAQAPVYAALLRACGLEESDRAAEVAADHADGTDYVVGDLVSLANLNYECIQAHTSDAGTNDPGTAGGAAFWSLRNYIFPAAKVYKPRDTAHESVSIHYHAAGDRQVILGCRGSVVWTLARGEIPKMSFTLMGRYERPSTQVQPVADISDYPVPYPITNRNTPDWVLHNVDNQFLSSLNITLGNSVVWRDLVNDAQVHITDRKGNWAAEVAGVEIADMDYPGLMESHLGVLHLGDLRLLHGPAASRQIEFYSTGAQLDTMTDTNSDELLHYSIGGMLIPDAGHELTVAYI